MQSLKGSFTLKKPPVESSKHDRSQLLSPFIYFFSSKSSKRPQKKVFPDKGYIHLTWVSTSWSLWWLTARGLQIGRKTWWFSAFKGGKCPFRAMLSGNQTQTRDLGGEEGVEDEDDGLWTRVEVQLNLPFLPAKVKEEHANAVIRGHL